MPSLKMPVEKDFFASERGVCVYVEVRSVAIRVEFETPDATGTVRLGTSEDCMRAAQAATEALQKYRAALLPLFEKVAAERARRAP